MISVRSRAPPFPRELNLIKIVSCSAAGHPLNSRPILAESLGEVSSSKGGSPTVANTREYRIA